MATKTSEIKLKKCSEEFEQEDSVSSEDCSIGHAFSPELK